MERKLAAIRSLFWGGAEGVVCKDDNNRCDCCIVFLQQPYFPLTHVCSLSSFRTTMKIRTPICWDFIRIYNLSILSPEKFENAVRYYKDDGHHQEGN